MNPILHQVVLVAVSAALAAVASARISWVLGEKWGLDIRHRGDPSMRDVMTVFAAIGAAVMAAFAANAAFDQGGIVYGLAADILTVPAVSFVWTIVIGGNKVLERLLNGIDIKLSSK